MNMLSKYVPNSGILVTKGSNVSVIDKIGEDVIRNVLISILKGGNIRDLTEERTRKRILLSNVALIGLYFNLLHDNPNIENELSVQIGRELSMSVRSVPQYKKDVLLSLIGMTKKGWDNILRGELGKKEYLHKLDESLKEIENDICSYCKKYEAEFKIGDKTIVLNTRSLLRCMMAIGSQTLTIRGSEKSTYGKLFERLVLGSVLTLLGFKKIEKNDFSGTEMVFWLSDPKNKRECDATALITPGVCVRFDIGFIGKGNTEITLDKVSRYDRMLELSSHGKKYRASSHTIVIVDTIGEGSKAWNQSIEIGGDVIQMNGCYWVKELAEKINKIYPKEFKNPLKGMSQVDSIKFIERKMAKLDLSIFLPPSVKNKE